MLVAEYYLEACANSDAGLTYDLLAAQQRSEMAGREVYCRTWNHEMQFCRILRVNWCEQHPDKPEQLTGKMLLLSPSQKLWKHRFILNSLEKMDCGGLIKLILIS